MTTKISLQRIRELCDKATPGLKWDLEEGTYDWWAAGPARPTADKAQPDVDYANGVDPDTVRAMAEEILRLRGALAEIAADTDTSNFSRDHLITCLACDEEVAKEALNAHRERFEE